MQDDENAVCSVQVNIEELKNALEIFSRNQEPQIVLAGNGKKFILNALDHRSMNTEISDDEETIASINTPRAGKNNQDDDILMHQSVSTRKSPVNFFLPHRPVAQKKTENCPKNLPPIKLDVSETTSLGQHSSRGTKRPIVWDEHSPQLGARARIGTSKFSPPRHCTPTAELESTALARRQSFAAPIEKKDVNQTPRIHQFGRSRSLSIDDNTQHQQARAEDNIKKSTLSARTSLPLRLKMDLASVNSERLEDSYDFTTSGTLLDWRSGIQILGARDLEQQHKQQNKVSPVVTTKAKSISPLSLTRTMSKRQGPKPTNAVAGIAVEDLVMLGELGRGACASVRRALHVPTLRLVAVKMVAVHDDGKRRQLLTELAALHQVSAIPLQGNGSTAMTESKDIAHIVAFYGAFTDPNAGCVCAVLEFMDGRSLHDVMESRNWQPLDDDALAVIAHGCVHALAVLHQNRQLHRDIKPSNVLLDSKWRVKLSDFGVSRAVDNTLGVARTYVGTLVFMAPERVVGNDYSFPSDLWSLGLCLATVALGRVPLPQNEGYWAVVRTICEEDSEQPRLDINEGRDHNLCHLTNACLSRKAQDRPTITDLLVHPYILRGANTLQVALNTIGTPNFRPPIWHTTAGIHQKTSPENLADLTEIARRACAWHRHTETQSHFWADDTLAGIADQLSIPYTIVARVFQEQTALLRQQVIPFPARPANLPNAIGAFPFSSSSNSFNHIHKTVSS
mmetsp:Transcript_23396/g.29169  ORF Transcript_23396/g.29169 Transcript_23396/m.29169 type:complete len:736 (-) Transcript_23396:283-2490(-)